MQFRSIGFLPVLMTLVMGTLFILKFQRESAETEYAIKLRGLIDESTYADGTTSWETRQKKFYKALSLMADAREAKIDLDRLLEKAMDGLEASDPYKRVLNDSLNLNLRIADELALFDEKNIERLEAGEPLRINAGGFSGEVVVLGNTIPYQFSPELETLYANLLLRPEQEARRYPRKMGSGAEGILTACRSAEIMSETSYARAKRAIDRS